MARVRLSIRIRVRVRDRVRLRVRPTMGGRAASVSRAVKTKVDASSHAPE